MPSPIAHSAVGYVIARFISTDYPGDRPRKSQVRTVLAAVGAANLPDLDFVPQILTGERYHHGMTHSIAMTVGFTVLCGTMQYAFTRRVSMQLILLCLMTYGSHLLLDLMTDGGQGIQLLWPFTEEYFKFGFHFFPQVTWSRQLFHPSQFRFVAFELAFSALLIGMLHLVRCWVWHEP